MKVWRFLQGVWDGLLIKRRPVHPHEHEAYFQGLIRGKHFRLKTYGRPKKHWSEPEQSE